MKAKNIASMLLLALLPGCSTGVPDGIEPVKDFDLSRYLGSWYEIARLDHSFERGLDNVQAFYEMREDGGVRVINKGYAKEKGTWKEAEGRAYFVGGPDVAHLKVSFFGPFYGSYIVFALDDDYQYSLVSGPDRSYLWLLARQPELAQETVQRLIGLAREAGFSVDELIYVKHDRVAEDGEPKGSA
jgi:apolipoprotein D and lipocalin family protein